jgi:hypothetical protein
LLRRNIAAGRTEQPAAAGIDQARSFRLCGERGQQHCKQPAVDRAHRGVEFTGRMNDCVEPGQVRDPPLGRGDVAGDCCGAKFGKLRR